VRPGLKNEPTAESKKIRKNAIFETTPNLYPRACALNRSPSAIFGSYIAGVEIQLIRGAAFGSRRW